ncbi:MAG: phosphodiesterase [Armatimonadota bacterium]|nr:phosphodiesterase [bacterium]
MKIGVISDTHGNIEAFKSALSYFNDADMIVHAGDVLYHPPRMGFTEGYDIPTFAETLNSLSIPMIIAQGNCDAQVYEELLSTPVQSPYAYVCCNGIRVVISHGHLLTREGMIELGKKYKADYFISGHTHLPVLERVDGVTLMNPGSPSLAKLEIGGKPIPSIGLITETGAKVINLIDGSTLFELNAEA